MVKIVGNVHTCMYPHVLIIKYIVLRIDSQNRKFCLRIEYVFFVPSINIDSKYEDDVWQKIDTYGGSYPLALRIEHSPYYQRENAPKVNWGEKGKLQQRVTYQDFYMMFRRWFKRLISIFPKRSPIVLSLTSVYQ